MDILGLLIGQNIIKIMGSDAIMKGVSLHFLYNLITE